MRHVWSLAILLVFVRTLSALPDHVILMGYLSPANAASPAIPVYDVVDTIYAKTLAGAVDGVNSVFTIRYASRNSNVEVFLNGLLQTEGRNADYVSAGKQIQFRLPPAQASSFGSTNISVHYHSTALN